MHPQVRMDHKDRCPICGMDLVPVAPEGGGGERDALVLGEGARRAISARTAPVERRPLVREIRTAGEVALDETRVTYVAARVDGRVEEVFANFPGAVVNAGDHLVRLYSPALLTTQEELLVATRAAAGVTASPLVENVRRRLRLWGVTDAEVDEVVRSGVARTDVTVHAPRGGTILEKSVREGQYVKEGDALYTIADLGVVWLEVQVYESDLPLVRFGQEVELRLEALPFERVTGTVGFVEPVVDAARRTVSLRVVVQNARGRLKPGMYALATIRVPLGTGGLPAPTGLEGRFACRMHPFAIADAPGDCPECGMPLERVPGERPPAPAAPPPVLAVPAEAVLTTGRRSLVYVEEEPGRYRWREPVLGPRAGDWFLVLGGLEEGDRVVVRGAFMIDSQFQVTGRPSLLYPGGAGGEAAPAHGGH
jgi:Cu(I)/Ag(I) efflux system membrane fusion protein